jgi:hypothetical protein
MRAGKRAARREVQKHIDFTEGHLAKITPPKDLVMKSSKIAPPISQSRRSHNFTFSLQRFLLDPPL